MIPAVRVTRRPPRAWDSYGPFETWLAAYDWAEDVRWTALNGGLPGFAPGVEVHVVEGSGLDLQPPFSTVDEDAPGDWPEQWEVPC